MSNKESTSYMFIFALIVCLVCSIALALVSEGLRPRKESNVALDIKKNILKAVALKDPLDAKAKVKKITKVYEEKIQAIVITPDGEIVADKSPLEIEEGENLYPVYIYKEDQQTIAYAFPIVGKGLWSTLYGYLALEADAKTIRGISFYQHGETPGLGAEIEKEWFTSNFKGKSVWSLKKEDLWPVEVIKGKVEDVIKDVEKKAHAVDGISGATITSRGVTEMIDRELRKYEPFFKKVRR